VKRANEWPADLFLSIHHDSVPARFLDVWDHEGVQRKYIDRFRGHSMFVSHENPQAAASLYFAQLLGGEVRLLDGLTCSATESLRPHENGKSPPGPYRRA